MSRFFNAKINRKLTALCLLLALLICAACCVSGYLQFRNATYKSYNDFAYEIGYVALSYVDGDRIAGYLDEKYFDPDTGLFVPDEEYQAMMDGIYDIYINTSLNSFSSGIYVCIPHNDNGEYTLTNLFDVRIVEAEDKAPWDVGVVDKMAVANPDEVMKIYETGYLSNDFFVHKSRFGYNSTAIIPVYNSEGETVALLMSDMPMPFVRQMLNKYLLNTIVITVALVVLFIGAFLYFIKKKVTQPLEIVSEEADSFITSEMKLSERLPEITQTDEIGRLADTVYKMEINIQDYIENLQAVTAEKERIGAELNVATKIQEGMLPALFPTFADRDDFCIDASMDPAKEVGGDFYDFFFIDENHLALVCADVSGKGVPAALFMVIAKTLIKNRTLMGGTPGEILTDVNNQLTEGNESNMFVTAWLAIIDLRTGEMTTANAGHEYPAIRRANGEFELIVTRHGMALAAMEGIEYKTNRVELYEGDTVFVYTDGVTEATDAQSSLFGNDRLLAALNRNPSADPAELLANVRGAIDGFVGDAEQFDDITMLSVKLKKLN